MDKNEEYGDDKVPDSKEERIKKYLEEKALVLSPYEKSKLNRNPFTRRLKKRTQQRLLKNLPRKEIGYILINRIYSSIEYIRISRLISDKFKPTKKKMTPTMKDNTVNGPLDGKGSWKTDYCPSVIDTTAGKFCPASAADKDKIIKEKIVKTEKYEDKIRREKYTPGVKIDMTFEWRSCGGFLFGTKPIDNEKKFIKTGVPKLRTEKTFEEKLCDTIGGLDRKSTSDRAASFTALQAALCRRLVPDVVKDNYAIITESLKNTLRKGHEADQAAAAKLVPILCIQLGEDQCEALLKSVKTPLLDLITDKTINASVRAECCQSLAIVCFLSSSANDDILKLMKTYERIFCGRHQQDDDGSVNKCAKAESVLHAIALDAWSLLLCKCSPAEVHALLGRATAASALSLSKLAQLLKATSVEMQKSAGVALSLVYELGAEFSERFGQNELATIIVNIKELAKESSKLRTKEHRKVQRAIFRDILKFFEDGVAPVETICVCDDRMKLDRWNLHVRYHKLAAGLGSGLQVSTGTSLLRSALLMGPLQRRGIEQKQKKEKPDEGASARSISRAKNTPSTTSEVKARSISRAKKPHHNTSEAKARSISRAKMRDKRSDIIYYSTD